MHIGIVKTDRVIIDPHICPPSHDYQKQPAIVLILNVRIISSAESLSSCSEHIFGGADHAAPHSLVECHSDVSSGQRLAARPLSLWLIQLTEGVRYQQKTPAVCDVITSWIIDIIQPNISKKSLCLKQSKQLIIPSLG